MAFEQIKLFWWRVKKFVTSAIFTLAFFGGCSYLAAQNAHGVNSTASPPLAQAEWNRLTTTELSCVDQKLHQKGSNLQTAIQQGIKPSDPQLADVRSLCKPSIEHRSSDTLVYRVANTTPPDTFVLLRSKPSTSAGRAIITLPNGILLRVLKRRDDGWWYVRVISSGKKGWARSQIGDASVIECCEIETGPVAQKPSFDCLKAAYADERAICNNAELALLDKIFAAGLESVRQLHGDQYMKGISVPLLQSRHSCNSDVTCIKLQQLASIKELQKSGAQISYPRVAENEVPAANVAAIDPKASAGGSDSSIMAQIKPAEVEGNVKLLRDETSSIPQRDSPKRVAQIPSNVIADKPVEPEAAKPKAEETVQQKNNEPTKQIAESSANRRAAEVAAYEEQAAKHNLMLSSLLGVVLLASSILLCLFVIPRREGQTIVANPPNSSAPLLDTTPSAPLLDTTSSAPFLDATSSAPLPDTTSSTPLLDTTPSTPLLETTIEPSAAEVERQPTIAAVEKETGADGGALVAGEPASSPSYEQISLDLEAHNKRLTTLHVVKSDSDPTPISGEGSSERTKEHAKIQADYIIEQLSQFATLRANGTLAEDEYRKLISKLIGLKDGDSRLNEAEPRIEFDFRPQKKMRGPGWVVMVSGVGLIVALVYLWVFV